MNVLGGGGYYGLVIVTSLHPQMYIDIGARIAGKQVGPILIIEGPPSPPPPE